MTKAIIKVNDKLIEMNVQPKYSHRNDHEHRVLSDDEAMEHIVLTPKKDPDEELQKELDDMVKDVTAEMKESFKAGLKATVTRMLGFTDSWGKWEVDRTNGRASQVTTLVSTEVEKFIRDEMKSYIPLLTKEDITKLVAAIKKDYKEKISYQLRQTVHEELNKQLKDLVATTIAEALNGQEFEVKKTCLDVLKTQNYKTKHK